MGGICGYLGDLNEGVLKTMQRSLGAGVTDSRSYSDTGVAVSALDSRSGDVASADGRVLVYEGHIWNMEELSRALHHTAGTNPADFLLRMISENGVESLAGVQGNYALAFCNAQKNELMLARDKIGHVPLYFTVYGNIVLFASRINAILSTQIPPKSLNLTGLDYYLSFGHIPSHETLFKNVLRVPAATIVRLQNGNWSCERYWQITTRVDSTVTQDEWATYFHDRLSAILTDYLNASDFPVGVLLSGIDSSILSALLRRRMEGNLHAFTVFFEDESINEPFAKETAEFLDLDYHEVLMVADDVAETLPGLALAYDDLLSEHLGSVPTFMLASQAAREVKTLFTGDGAGLIFLESEPAQRIHGLARALPAQSREWLVEYPFTSVHPIMFKGPLRAVDALIKELGMRCSTAARVYYGQLIFEPHERFALYNEATGTTVVTNTFLPMLDLIHRARSEVHSPDDYLSNIFLFKTRMTDTWGFYIPRVQRIFTHFSIFPWLPYLDERILELAAMIPKRPGYVGETKTVLRGLASKYELLPPHIINQRKIGMQFPLMTWMQSQLREYFEKVIDDGMKRTGRLLRQSEVRRVLRKRDPRKTFALVMLFLWLEEHFPDELSL